MELKNNRVYPPQRTPHIRLDCDDEFLLSLSTADTMGGIGTRSSTHPYDTGKEDWLSRADVFRRVQVDAATAKHAPVA